MTDIEQENSIDEQEEENPAASLMTDSVLNPDSSEENTEEGSDTSPTQEVESEEIENSVSDDVVLADDLIYEKDEEPVKIVSPYDRPGKWYVVHTQSGYENKVQGNLAQRTKAMNKEDYIHEVVIPLENVVEFKQGKRVEVQKKCPRVHSCSCPRTTKCGLLYATLALLDLSELGINLPTSERVENFLGVNVDGDGQPVKRAKLMDGL